eukprot:5973295-Prymnesium_polylepis.1
MWCHTNGLCALIGGPVEDTHVGTALVLFVLLPGGLLAAHRAWPGEPHRRHRAKAVVVGGAAVL